ncbi:MAG: MFS transporter [Porticoccaceae bacterium]
MAFQSQSAQRPPVPGLSAPGRSARHASIPGNVWLFVLCQALTMSMPAFVVFAGGIVGHTLAPDPAYATLPVALFMLGSAGSILPLILAMQRFGRKKIFLLAGAAACIGCALAMVALVQGRFVLYCAGLVLMGLGLAAGQQYRFAAMESVAPQDAAGAASRVLLGGLIAAFLGPELVTWGESLLPVSYLASFGLLLTVLIAALVALGRYREPQPTADAGAAAQPRPLGVILRQPAVPAAVLAGAAGFAVMSLVMTATPLHMHVINHHSLEATKWVLQSHIAAMFAPSFVVPWLVRRVGLAGLIALGLAAFVAVIIVVFARFDFFHYWVALVLLGVGWNFLFVGGTTLLSEHYRRAEAFRMQALNDLTLFSLQAFAALGAGWLLTTFGWRTLLLSALPLLALALLALLNWRLRPAPPRLADIT